MGTAAKLFYTDSERDADLYYLTGFHVGDPIACLVVDGRNVLVLNDLEKDRAASYPKVHEVVRLVSAEAKAKEEAGALPPRGVARTALVLKSIADERGIESFDVPGNFPVALADALRSQGLGLRWCRPPFVPERACKSAEEVEAIRGAIGATEAGLRAGIDRIRRSEIKDGMLFEEGQALTSEMVRRTINKTLLDHDAFCESTIVAGGLQAVDPHDRGSGPLAANSPIILDVFPRHFPTRYHGDMTRTVVRGQASDTVKRMHDAVLASKLAGEGMIKAGVDGKDVHTEVMRVIEEAGFVTEERDGRMVGFFHGTGHGLGLDVHEYPGVGKASYQLKAGHVVTVEPGLYYPEHGGLRIEDDVLVTGSGCENLCTMEIELEV